jgi:hypothetical protein
MPVAMLATVISVSINMMIEIAFARIDVTASPSLQAHCLDYFISLISLFISDYLILSYEALTSKKTLNNVPFGEME